MAFSVQSLTDKYAEITLDPGVLVSVNFGSVEILISTEGDEVVVEAYGPPTIGIGPYDKMVVPVDEDEEVEIIG